MIIRNLTLLFFVLSIQKGYAADSCSASFEGSARSRFNALSKVVDEYDGSSWQKLDVSEINEYSRELQTLRKMGLPVALLVADGRARNGERRITGYVYKIVRKGVKNVSVEDSLSIVISLKAPNYFQDTSQGLIRYESSGWTRKPKEKDLVTIKVKSIISAKYNTDAPFQD